jgi:hypothetical protein
MIAVLRGAVSHDILEFSARMIATSGENVSRCSAAK